jgi:hypothetical protein
MARSADAPLQNNPEASRFRVLFLAVTISFFISPRRA